MIQEQDILEFNNIINGRNNIEFDQDSEDFFNAASNENGSVYESSETSLNSTKFKPREGNTSSIVLIAGITGILFLLSIFIAAIIYIIIENDGSEKRFLNLRSTKSLKIPGLRKVYMDPTVTGKKYKVFVSRVTIPPPCIIGDYGEFYSSFDDDDGII